MHTTHTKMKLSENILPKMYTARARTLNKRWNAAATGFFDCLRNPSDKMDDPVLCGMIGRDDVSSPRSAVRN